jgi:hypothetical protein
MTATAVTVGVLPGAGGAAAGPSGRRNVALGLGAATAYSAMQGNAQATPVLGAGALVAYASYRLALRRQERRRQRLARRQAWFKANRAWLKQNGRLPKDFRPGPSPAAARRGR